MGFNIKVCPSMLMRIIEYKNRVEDKIMLGISLNKKGSVDEDLKGLMENLEELEFEWQKQMGMG